MWFKTCYIQIIIVILHDFNDLVLIIMTLLITIVMLLFSVAAMCVRIIVKKDGRFSSQHIGQSKAMREQGIDCVNAQDRQAQRTNTNRIDVNKL